jgi:hypothetical protein
MQNKDQDWLQLGSGKKYLERVKRPIHSLIFISPFLIIYQVGTAMHPWATGQEAPAHVLAFTQMLTFFSVFGAVGNYMPLSLVVAGLLAWHLRRGDKTEVRGWFYVGMLAESILWAVPMIMLGLVVLRSPAVAMALQATPHFTGLNWQTAVVLSVGAGIYEELIFRLMAMCILSWVLLDVMKMRMSRAVPMIILFSAITFSGYHYLGDEVFHWGSFLYRTAMGIYLAGIFVYRGFGITVGCHAFYDLMAVIIAVWRGQL